MPPKPVLPQPAATLPGEADILATVVADLSDDTAKLVYADWLDERDDARGSFLCEFVTAVRTGRPLPPSDPFSKSWRDLIGATVVEAARAHGCAHRTDTFLRLARPALALLPADKPDHELPVGASKFGGRPDLPAGSAWPVRASGKPLAFFGQVNLADLAGSIAARDLPDAGLFSVFYDLFEEGRDTVDYDGKDPDGWRLFYFPGATDLLPHDPPSDLGQYSRFDPHRLTFADFLTLPDPMGSPWGDDLGFEGNYPAWSKYFDMVGELPWHHGEPRILGHAESFEGYRSQPKSVRHLLSIGPNRSPEWLTADGSVRTLTFMIAEDDLRDRRFDRVWHHAEWHG